MLGIVRRSVIVLRDGQQRCAGNEGRKVNLVIRPAEPIRRPDMLKQNIAHLGQLAPRQVCDLFCGQLVQAALCSV